MFDETLVRRLFENIFNFFQGIGFPSPTFFPLALEFRRPFAICTDIELELNYLYTEMFICAYVKRNGTGKFPPKRKHKFIYILVNMFILTKDIQ